MISGVGKASLSSVIALAALAAADLVVCLSFAGTAVAQQSAVQAQDRMMCNDPKMGDKDTITGCSNLIKSGRDTKHILAADFANRGFAYFDTDDYDHAAADYDRAIQLDPKFAQAYSGRCAVQIKKGNLAQAIADCNQAIALDPKLAIAYNDRGLAKQAQGDTAGGDADIARAGRLDPAFAK
jgi:tetratricopeptide (TPR) repeat protein